MPKVVDHDVRRQEVLDATWLVIAAEGIEAATMRRIAEAAGCTTGRITHYFDNKDDIIVAALRYAHEAATARQLEQLALHSGLDGLRALLFEALPLDQERAMEWRVWLGFWAAAVASRPLLEEQQRRSEEWRQLVEDLLRDAVTAGEADAHLDVEREADDLVALIDGLGVQATLEPGHLPPLRQQQLVDARVDRLRPTPPPPSGRHRLGR